MDGVRSMISKQLTQEHAQDIIIKEQNFFGMKGTYCTIENSIIKKIYIFIHFALSFDLIVLVDSARDI